MSRGPGHIADSMPRDTCLRCAYDVGGMPDDAVCPECAHPVAASRRAALLRFAPPEYLARVSRGLVVYAVSLFAHLGVAILEPERHVLEAFDLGSPWLIVVLSAVASVPLFILAAGFCMMTTPDPRLVPFEKRMSLRRGARLALAAWIGLSVGRIAYLVLNTYVFLPGNMFLVVLEASSLLASAGGIAGDFVLMTYLAGLVRRVPDATAVRWMRRGRWAVLVLAIIGHTVAHEASWVAVGLLWWLALRARMSIERVRRDAQAIGIS